MKKWEVSLPISGYVCVEVEAEDEESAIEAAFMSDITTKDIEEWETHHQIARGNVCSAVLNEAYAQEMPE